MSRFPGRFGVWAGSGSHNYYKRIEWWEVALGEPVVDALHEGTDLSSGPLLRLWKASCFEHLRVVETV